MIALGLGIGPSWTSGHAQVTAGPPVTLPQPLIQYDFSGRTAGALASVTNTGTGTATYNGTISGGTIIAAGAGNGFTGNTGLQLTGSIALATAIGTGDNSTQGYTVFLVVNPPGAAASGRRACMFTTGAVTDISAGNAAFGIFNDLASHYVEIQGAALAAAYSAIGTTDLGPQLAVVGFGTGVTMLNAIMRANGAALPKTYGGGGSGVGSSTRSLTTIGGDSTYPVTNYVIGEIQVHNGQLTLTEVQAIEAALKSKWGTP